MFKITHTSWYKESARCSEQLGQNFATNAIISLALLAALAISACAAIV